MLESSGFYEKVRAGHFRSEKAIAKAWAEAVYGVSKDFKVELGTRIYRLPNGRYATGGVYSSGAKGFVKIMEAPSYNRGRWVGVVHTHQAAPGKNSLSEYTKNSGYHYRYKQPGGDIIAGHSSDDYGGDIGFALSHNVNVHAYGGASTSLVSFNPAAFESVYVAPETYEYACRYTSPPQC